MNDPVADIQKIGPGVARRRERHGQPGGEEPAPAGPAPTESESATKPTAASGDDRPASPEGGPRKSGLLSKLLQAGLALAALAVGIAIMFAFTVTKPEPPRAAQRVQGPLVAVEGVGVGDVPVEVVGFGTVQPRRQVDLVPQVGGRVVKVHPALTAGGIIPAGQTIVQIDRRDFELAVRTAEANVQEARASIERARTALAVERAEAEVRIAEWKDEHGEAARVPDLVARRPQIREREAELASAEAQLASAQANLERAELDLERTTLTADFDARVMSESIDPGQTAVANQSVGTLYSREVMRVIVPLEDEAMRWLELPEPRADVSGEAAYQRGVPVRITGRYGGARREWSGRALHTTGQVDPRSRLIEVVVEVRQPLGQTDPPPLVPGMFVEARFEGPVLEGAARIPRHAIRGEGKVWVAENLEAELSPIAWSEPTDTQMTLRATLRQRTVEVLRLEREEALIGDGLREGDLVITSALDVATDGMDIRLPTPRTRPPSDAKQRVAPEMAPVSPADVEPDAPRQPQESEPRRD